MNDKPITVVFTIRMSPTGGAVEHDIRSALTYLAQQYIEAKEDWVAMVRNPAIEVNVLKASMYEQPTLWDEDQ